MSSYIGRRVLTGVLTIFVSIFLNFMLIHLAPGDPISLLSGQDIPAPEMEAVLRAKYGLDQPIFSQFLTYLKNIAGGDLGQSILSGRPVMQMIIADRPIKICNIVIQIVGALEPFLIYKWSGHFLSITKNCIFTIRCLKPRL